MDHDRLMKSPHGAEPFPGRTAWSQNHAHRGWRAVLVGLLLAVSGRILRGQSNQISGFSVDAQGRMQLECNPSPEFYVILLAGDHVGSIASPRDIQLGGDRVLHLRDPDLPWGSAFYRIKYVAIAKPEDTDGDGIDDVYEMRRRDILHPLNPLDGSEDGDRDGRNNLEEYRNGTDPAHSDSLTASEDIRFDSGQDYSVALKSDGTMWAWGRNRDGQLGNGTTNDSKEPIQVATNRLWKSVSAGLAHTLAVAKDGTLWGWGWNQSGQVGDGTQTRRLLPVQVANHRLWQAVSAGREFTAAIATDGTLWTWGYNGDGRLGDGTYSPRSRPVQIANDRTWRAVSAGDSHTLALATDGTLWAWGNNLYGQLGDGSSTSRLRPVQVGPQRIWSAVSAGPSQTVALARDGSLWAWGNNSLGALGDGTTANRLQPIQVAPHRTWARVRVGGDGLGYTMALATDGTLWGWGQNGHGVLGDGTADYKLKPVQVLTHRLWKDVMPSSYRTLALADDGTLWSWGDFPWGTINNKFSGSVPERVGAQGTWQDIGAGWEHSLAVDADGAVWSWGGHNGDGRLGNGTTNSSLTPTRVLMPRRAVAVSAGKYHSMALAEDGTLWAWGSDYFRQLGSGSTIGRDRPNRLVPFQVDPDRRWAFVSCGGVYTMAVAQDGTLWGWGYNHSGELGSGNTESIDAPIQIAPTRRWASVSAGESRTLAIADDGSLWGWGSDGFIRFYTKSGISYHPLLLETGVHWSQVSSAHSQAVALASDGFVLSLYGLPGSPKGIPRQDGFRFRQVSAGTYYSLALGVDGTLYGWGKNDYGQFGNGTADWYRHATEPILVTPDHRWNRISAGPTHALGIATDGSLWAWGGEVAVRGADPIRQVPGGPAFGP